MRGLKGTWAWLPHDEQITAKYSRAMSIVAALVAARPADVPDVVAGLSAGPPAGATARAALRVRREPLLDVVLLVGGRVDELHPAVDAGQRSVDVGHEAFLSSGAVVTVPVRPMGGHRRRDDADASGGRPAPRTQVPFMESLCRAHGFDGRSTIHRSPESGVARAGTGRSAAATASARRPSLGTTVGEGLQS